MQKNNNILSPNPETPVEVNKEWKMTKLSDIFLTLQLHLHVKQWLTSESRLWLLFVPLHPLPQQSDDI